MIALPPMRRRLRWTDAVRATAAGIIVVATTGCMLREDIPDPAIPIPDRYRAAPRLQHDAPPRLDWWRGFRSPELTALMEEAQRANLDIAAAAARVMQADAQARIAGAPLLPLVSGEVSVTRSRPSTATFTGGGGGIAPDRSTHSVFLNASYEIDFWGKNRAALAAAEASASASRYDHDVITLTTLASVANAYFQVRSTQDRLAIAARNIRAAERVFGAIKSRVGAGTATDLESAQQQSIVASLRAGVPQLQQIHAQNLIALATLIGRPPESIHISGGSLRALALPRVTPGLPSQLLVQRPDIQRAEAQLSAATANVANARAQFFPSIQLTGQGGYQSAALAALFSPQSVFYSAAASATQPIFDGMRLANNLALSKARQDELLQLYRKTVITAFADVDNALVALRTAAIRIRLLGQVVTASRRAFDLAEIRLREGTADIISVLNTQTSLFQAEDQLAVAELARIQALLSLYQALGGGWLPDDLLRVQEVWAVPVTADGVAVDTVSVGVIPAGPTTATAQ